MNDITLSQSLTLLWRYLRPRRGRVTLLGGVILAGIGLQLLAPQVIRRLLDMAQAGAGGRVLTQTAVLFFLTVLCQKLLSLLSTYLGEDLGWQATNQLRVDLARHVLQLDMSFHKTHTPGELIERIEGDVGTLAESFSNLIVQVFGNGLLILGLLALQFREGWQFGLIGLAYAAATLLFLRAVQKPTVAIWRHVRQGYAELFGLLEERFNGTEDIRANGGEAFVLARSYPLMAAVNAQRVRGALLGGATFSAGYLLYTLTWIGTLGLAATLFLRGELTIGTVFLVSAYVGLLENPLRYIRRQVETLQRAMASIGRIAALFQLQPRVLERAAAVLPAAAPAVRFERVSFAYQDLPAANEPASRAVLHDLTFHLPAGRVLGLLGRTGSGKTTLTRLLFRLYDVDAGAITLDGIDLRHAALADLRRHVGMVTQEVQLFAATVRDNLTLFRAYDATRPPIADADILAALDTLGLSAWLQTLPAGLDTRLAAGGQSLSAGEAQLLALARVFLQNPRLVILDEASSRLDPATEQRLEQAIDRLLAGRTAIVIAHRLSTVQRADDILILENGRLAEHGPRVALAANPHSRFARLLRTGLQEVLT